MYVHHVGIPCNVVLRLFLDVSLMFYTSISSESYMFFAPLHLQRTFKRELRCRNCYDLRHMISLLNIISKNVREKSS